MKSIKELQQQCFKRAFEATLTAIESSRYDLAFHWMA